MTVTLQQLCSVVLLSLSILLDVRYVVVCHSSSLPVSLYILGLSVSLSLAPLQGPILGEGRGEDRSLERGYVRVSVRDTRQVVTALSGTVSA